MGYILTEEDFDKYYENFINETKSKDFSYVTHYRSELKHIERHHIKITEKIAKLLYGDKIERTFHISQIEGDKGIDNFIKTINRKMPVSSFTYMGTNLANMSGVQTDGGVIYELFGQILFRGFRDIMSIPDNRGKRWVSNSKFFEEGSDDANFFYNTIRKFTYENPTPSLPTEHDDDRSPKVIAYLRYVATYVNLCEYVIASRIESVKEYVNSRPPSDGSWDEILIQNYTVHDVIWTLNKLIHLDWVREFLRLSKKEIFNEDDKMLYRELRIKHQEIQDKLDKIAKGEVIYTDETRVAMNWVNERGGFHKSEDFKASLREDENNELSEYLYKEQKEMKKKIKITEEQLKRLMELKQLDERRHTYIEPKEEEVSEEEIEENDDMSVAPPEEVDENKDLPTPPSEEEEKNNQVYESIKKEFKRFL